MLDRDRPTTYLTNDPTWPGLPVKHTWEDKALIATRGTRLGAILDCAMNVGRAKLPRFEGRATISSDGCVHCNFVDKGGYGHVSAFIGSVDDLSRNVEGLAEHLNL